MVHPDIRLVLFDIGGVLVELSGVETLRGWMQGRVTADELWQLWLRSPSVRAFETGRLEAEVFAARIVAELDIAVTPADFLAAFVGWPLGPYPGALELLASIPPRYRRALLSNSNALHWPRALAELAAHSTFEACFVSHLTGKLKPDAEAFQHVVDALSCSASEVLFLDDNRLNVEAARAFGMHARLTRGVAEAEAALVDAGILPGLSNPSPVC